MSSLAAPMIELDAPAPRDLGTSIRGVFAEITRYPLDILEPEAMLEEDLGIDSVKLGEVFSVLRERYDLPETMGLAPEQLSTIGRISDALSRFLAERQEAEPSTEARIEAAAAVHGLTPGGSVVEAAPPPASTETAMSGEGLLEAVRQVFAEVTRYPRDILEAEAMLEEDLGIDSVKLGEVFSVLRERYDLPETMGLSPEQLSTIGRIAESLEAFLVSSTAAETSRSAPVFAEGAVTGRENGTTGVSGANSTGGSNGTNGSNGYDRQIASPAAPHHLRSIVAPTAPASAPDVSSFAALIPELQPFAGKVAVVTGSGHGLGKEIATYLASLGATVVVNSFHSRDRGMATAEEIVAAGGRAHHIWASVANPEHVDTLFDEVEKRHGAIDFFIASASNGMLARLEDITAQHWEKAFRTNIVGLHQSALRAVRLMRKQGGGKIITMSSPASQGYVDYFGCMGAVKAAVESLTRSMAIEFAADNIQVNCVSPGPVYGELLDKWPESDRLIPQWEANTAYPRLCEGKDVSHFVAYLLSDTVKLFTGSVLVLDGGISSQGW